jgi:hypothetical protein
MTMPGFQTGSSITATKRGSAAQTQAPVSFIDGPTCPAPLTCVNHPDAPAQCYYLGPFGTEVQAAQARDKKAIEFFGEYALAEFPDETGGGQPENGGQKDEDGGQWPMNGCE